MFFGSSNKRLARIIDTTSPTAFRGSIREIEKRGVTVTEKRGLVLAQNRARAQLKRRNLSPRERRQFRTISRIRLPRVTRRKRRP